MVKAIAVDGGSVQVQIALTVAGCPLRNEIDRRVKDAVTATRRRRCRRPRLHGHDRRGAGRRCASGSARRSGGDRRVPAGATATPRAGPSPSPIRPAAPGCSSSRRARAAWASRRSRPTSPSPWPSGASRVGVVDADVWGFSIPRMLGVDRPPVVIDEMLVPPEAHGVRVHLHGLLRRGGHSRSSGGARCCTRRSSSSSPTCTGTNPTSSSSTCPPGTGDISISLAQFLPRAEVYVVTTPQPAAQKVAQRAAFMAARSASRSRASSRT